jgi:hypothetical protein
MKAQQSFTPEQVMQTIEHVIATQQGSGYKIGWIKFEMERRCDKAIARLHAYSIGGRSTLPGLAMEIATKEISRNEAINLLRESWDHEQSYINEIVM